MCLPPLFLLAYRSLCPPWKVVVKRVQKNFSLFFLLFLLFPFPFFHHSGPPFWWQGVVTPLSFEPVKIWVTLKKHACNEEASLQCCLNIVMYDRYSNCKHHCYNQLHAPSINACVYQLHTRVVLVVSTACFFRLSVCSSDPGELLSWKRKVRKFCCQK